MARNHKAVELGNKDYNCSTSPSSTFVYHSTRIKGLLQSKSEYETALDFEITASKDHWSELQQPLSVAKDSNGGEKGKVHLTNGEIVQSLRRQFPQVRNFFRDFDDSLVLGKKIAEGAQVEVFKARLKGFSDKYVLKVFKEGSLVLDLQKQWPLGMLNRCVDKGTYFHSKGCSTILDGMVVMNERFAFMMIRCVGDLRKLIDRRMECNRCCAPFSYKELHYNMYTIAVGMKHLHKDNIIHRDLKASNVLVFPQYDHQLKDLDSLYFRSYSCRVANFECSVGVMGTSFWRAPEVLEGVKVHKVTPNLFTKKTNVYSFAMTCYEMIIGRLAFEGVKKSDYDVVL